MSISRDRTAVDFHMKAASHRHTIEDSRHHYLSLRVGVADILGTEAPLAQ